METDFLKFTWPAVLSFKRDFAYSIINYGKFGEGSTPLFHILNAYLNENISNEERFLMIEQTINENFAGTGIAKFIAGNAWTKASKET